MIQETKEIYKELANLYVPDWETKNKNDLVREAIVHKKDSSYDGYISAIVLRYWGKMIAYYHKCKLVISVEDAHAWLVEAIMYAVRKHPWTNPDSSIYEDENGPDKVINRVIESRRLTFYQQLNRYNRKINSCLLSIESMTEDFADANTPTINDNYTVEYDDIILETFSVKDYFNSFMLDAIIYENCTLDENHLGPMCKHLRFLDDHYCRIFANRYNLDFDRVKRASSYITRMERSNIMDRLEKAPTELKRMFKRWGIINC